MSGHGRQRNTISSQCRKESMTIKKCVIVICLTIFALAVSFCANCEFSAEKYSKSNQEAIQTFNTYQSSADTPPCPSAEGGEVRNVILCIGDGMGFGHVELARIKTAGPAGKLNMEMMPIFGIVSTRSADSHVTDSAAAATAMATGFKTKNGMISMLPDGRKCVTILEAARQKSMSTGLVSTAAVTSATPACFAAHQRSRGMQAKIAEDLLGNKVNVLIGGGRKYFLHGSAGKSEKGDLPGLIGRAKKAGYVYASNAEELEEAGGDYVLGLLASDELTTKLPEPSLARLTGKAIEILSKNKKGFFLMVEGAQIDWAGNEQNADDTVKQTLAFDMAVKAAVDFARTDGYTLVVVTSDHDTGGLVIRKGGADGKDVKLLWTTHGHSGRAVPLYAFGPCAGVFEGACDNTEIPKRIAKLLGIESFPGIMK